MSKQTDKERLEQLSMINMEVASIANVARKMALDVVADNQAAIVSTGDMAYAVMHMSRLMGAMSDHALGVANGSDRADVVGGVG